MPIRHRVLVRNTLVQSVTDADTHFLIEHDDVGELRVPKADCLAPDFMAAAVEDQARMPELTLVFQHNSVIAAMSGRTLLMSNGVAHWMPDEYAVSEDGQPARRGSGADAVDSGAKKPDSVDDLDSLDEVDDSRFYRLSRHEARLLNDVPVAEL